MVYVSAKSREKVFHFSSCGACGRIRAENRQVFRSMEEARRAGYRMCSCCAPVGRQLRRERAAVMRFCGQHAMTCRLEDGHLHIGTFSGRWQVISTGRANTLLLYHKNSRFTLQGEERGIRIPGYHFQHSARCTTLMGFLCYIVQHDRYCSDRKAEARRMPQKNGAPENKRRAVPRADNRYQRRKCGRQHAAYPSRQKQQPYRRQPKGMGALRRACAAEDVYL